MTPLELDHVFCFCSPELLEVAALESHGFRVNAGRRHQAQGTANRAVMFRENYFEFLFLADEEEAKANPLQLHRRAHWQKTGASPFGIALRGTLSASDRHQFWDYRPAYMQSGVILIHKAPNDSGPLIFLMPSRGDSLSAMQPINSPTIDPNLMEHTAGTSKIISLQITGPGYQWPLGTPIPSISLSHSKIPHMRVRINGDLDAEFSVNDLVSIAT